MFGCTAMNRHISTKKRNLRIRSALLYRSLHANPLCKVLLFYFQLQFYHIISDYLLIAINIFFIKYLSNFTANF